MRRFILQLIGSDHNQLLRYILVGIFNTAFGYGAYAALLFLGLKYPIASLIALVLGIVVSFTTQGTIVFKNANAGTFVKFVLSWILIYIINVFLISIFVRLSFDPYWAGAIATAPITILSYFILKLIVFHKKPCLRRSQLTGK